MIPDDAKLANMTAGDLRNIVKDVPKTYFHTACKELQGSCALRWNKDLHEFGEKLTGLDTTKPEAKAKIRGVYEYAERLYAGSMLAIRTVFVDVIKYGILGVAIYFGLKG